MAESRRFVKVFLASPGDLTDERKAAKLVVDEFNALLAEEFGYQVELVGWEDTVSVFGRPQATINRELERCELFVGLMWKHWGTPPDNNGKYTSGFEEEFKVSVERRIKTKTPEISLLFKEIDPEFLRDPGVELKKVLAFKNQLIEEKTVLFETFSDVRDFETKFRRCITTYIKNLRAEELALVSGQKQAPASDEEKPETGNAVSQALETPLSVEGAQFLSDFIMAAEHVDENNPLVAVDIARFRLLSCVVKDPGNDDLSLGIHDANLIFTRGSHFKFGRPELRGLIRSGLDRYAYENVPLWHWVAEINGLSENVLPFYSIFRNPTRQVSALVAMRLISEPLPSGSVFDRGFFLNSWFADDAMSVLKVAALKYLGEFGVSSDLSAIRGEIDRNDNQTIGAAIDAFIRINFRENRELAIQALYDFQPASISLELVSALFSNGAGLSTDILLAGIDHQNSDVRHIVVKLLRTRDALPNNIAEQLLSDTDARIRYESLKYLVDAGHTFSDADAKKIIIKPAPNKGMGGWSVGSSDPAGEACWTSFRRQRLQLLNAKELEEIANKDPLFDQDPQFILFRCQFKQRGDELRKAVDNQYKIKFAEWVSVMENEMGSDTDIVRRTQSIEDFLRKELTRKGLDVICEKADPNDLKRIRDAINSGFISYSAADMEYLKRFGEWEDIQLIINLFNLTVAGRAGSLLAIPDDSNYKDAAKVIYKLGQTRLDEVLSLKAPNQLISYIVIEATDNIFSKLSNTTINSLLLSDDEVVRRNVAVKCIRSLSKKRLTNILFEYISGDNMRYYNVIHWLDFGVSVPRNRTLVAADKVLKKKWTH